MLTSSISSILGGVGFGAYAPANIFMDYFIHAQRKDGLLGSWVSVNFDEINFNEEYGKGIHSDELPALIKHLLAIRSLAQVCYFYKGTST